jgi:hypothetical protein
MVLVFRKMLAPDDAKSSLLLPALQGDGLPWGELGAQSTQPASDGADVNGVSPLHGRSFASLIVQPHPKRQNHLGAGTLLGSIRH